MSPICPMCSWISPMSSKSQFGQNLNIPNVPNVSIWPKFECLQFAQCTQNPTAVKIWMSPIYPMCSWMSPMSSKSQSSLNLNVPNILVNVSNLPNVLKVLISDSFQSLQYAHQYCQYLQYLVSNILNLAIFSTVQACTVPNIPISQYDLNILKTSSSDF